MKKLFALALALMVVFSCSAVAFANETTLTTTVPSAVYTLNIPADTEIQFNDSSTEIGTLSVSDESGFAAGKNLRVTVSYSPFTNNSNESTIPFTLTGRTSEGSTTSIYSGNTLTFRGSSTGGVSVDYYTNQGKSVKMLMVAIEKDDWGKALAGEYTAAITFAAEVVNS